MRSLRLRLGLGLVAILVVMFAVQFLLVSLAMRQVTRDFMLDRMVRDIDRLLAGLTISAEGVPGLPNGGYPQGHELPYSGLYYRVVVNGNALRSRSIWDHSLEFDVPAVGEMTVGESEGPLSQPLLILSKGFMKSGYPVTITVAEDLSKTRTVIDEFNTQYMVLSLLLLLFLVLFQLWLLGRAIHSLTATRLDLNRIARGDADRLPEDVPFEIYPLVNEFNRLLELLSRRLVQTRNSVGNLAHALKTPLSVLFRLSEDTAVSGNPVLQNRIREQLQAIRTTIDRELNRARLAGDGKSGRRFNPSVDLAPLVETLRQIHSNRDLDISVQLDDERAWMANREDMLELIGNLLDNACKWANSRIRVHMPQQHRVVIEDDGPGCAPETLTLLTGRGTRLDESADGHGIGLSIARDIVDHYRGELHFTASTELGGLMVAVYLNVH